MSREIIKGSVLYRKNFELVNKHKQTVPCTVLGVQLVDKTIGEVFAYGEKNTDNVAFCTRIPHGETLYEGGPPSEPGKDLVLNGTNTVESIKVSKETFDLLLELE